MAYKAMFTLLPLTTYFTSLSVGFERLRLAYCTDIGDILLLRPPSLVFFFFLK